MATRWGLCGAGKISHDFSVAMKTCLPETTRSLDRAQEFAKKHDIPKAYGSYEELANDPDIDIVYVGVLHTQHCKVGLLFLKAGKNVLCEKPFAMNSRQVQDLVAEAKQSNVFLMEAIWSRCFPVYAEVRRLLAEEAIGEVKLVKAYFGSPQLHVPRSVEKELGGGALLDIGVYCLQFVLMVFGGERPLSIQASGVLLDSGVDESVVVALKFSRNRMAFCAFSISARLPNDAVICGTEGSIKVLGPMHCPTTLMVNDKETEYPLPEPQLPLNFTNSTGLRYEAQEVVAVAARNLNDAQNFAQKHNISHAYGSYEELSRDQDVDVVYIGVIHPYHVKTCLIFANAKKHILCEKPLAMNTKEVQEILSAAKRNNVFLMEAVWTRFFPASVEIRRLLSQGEAGDVKMVRSEFGVPLLDVPRAVQKELGGGGLLDVGIYCLQFICMVYNGEKPESIQAVGICTETGVDETVVVTLKYSKNRMAVFTCSISVQLPNEAVIMGTKYSIKVPAHMWCPTCLIVNGKETEFPVPEPCMPLNFLNSTGMRYEAQEVRQCLLKGLKESALMSHSDSLLLAEIEDEIRRQVGVVYPQDSK
ncbi:hypothetical protein WMY93_013682 [Mugilogobius chulae]|uniref:Trans-1,2-dihydrobenzene-1,2-diol dehydrogenase n=1 Tax=Mugilogobius chulae TaxID=88201 RepID=A0AAW0PD05_9GOBI